MSKLSRIMKRVHKDIAGIEYTLFEKFDEWITHTSLYDRLETYYYNVKYFLRNLPLFLKLAWKFRAWDSSYNLYVLIETLKATARSIDINSRFVGHRRIARRCLTAAGLLDKAYNRDIDKTILYLLHKNKWGTTVCEDNPKLYEMYTKYVTPKHIYDGMYTAARKRSEAAEKEAKKEAWQYLHKYIEHFWE